MNITQKQVLLDVLKNCIDEILEKKCDYLLKQLTEPVEKNNQEIFDHLNPEIIMPILRYYKIPNNIRQAYTELLQSLSNRNQIALTEQSIQVLCSHPNHNPYYLADIAKQEKQLKNIPQETLKTYLCLREMYLGMSSLQTDSYNGVDYSYRLGETPLNLDKMGNKLSVEEIQTEIKNYIQSVLNPVRRSSPSSSSYIMQTLQNNSVDDDLNFTTLKILTEEDGTINDESMAMLLQMQEFAYDYFRKPQTSTSHLLPQTTTAQYRCGNSEKDLACNIQQLKYLADRNDANAQVLLGRAYLTGIGVCKNRNEAEKWLRKAKSQPNTVPELFAKGLCFKEGIDSSIDLAQAIKYFQLAADKKYSPAQNALGICYLYGIGVTQNYQIALRWLRAAAEQNNASAQSGLGLCYIQGQGVTRDTEVALKWLNLSANQGHAVGQYSLGVYYYESREYVTAEKWFRLAANQDYSEAQRNLGICYYNGHGVTKDCQTALHWLRMAADQGDKMAKSYLQQLELNNITTHTYRM